MDLFTKLDPEDGVDGEDSLIEAEEEDGEDSLIEAEEEGHSREIVDCIHWLGKIWGPMNFIWVRAIPPKLIPNEQNEDPKRRK